jgi:hypothetical protein
MLRGISYIAIAVATSLGVVTPQHPPQLYLPVQPQHAVPTLFPTAFLPPPRASSTPTPTIKPQNTVIPTALPSIAKLKAIPTPTKAAARVIIQKRTIYPTATRSPTPTTATANGSGNANVPTAIPTATAMPTSNSYGSATYPITQYQFDLIVVASQRYDAQRKIFGMVTRTDMQLFLMSLPQHLPLSTLKGWVGEWLAYADWMSIDDVLKTLDDLTSYACTSTITTYCYNF